MYYRMIGAALIALATAHQIGPRRIRDLKKLHFGQTIYELGPSHQQKQGTPVMGGLMMAAGILLGSLICHPRMDLANMAEAEKPVLPEGLLEEATGKPGAAMAVKKGSFSEQMIRCL